MGDSFGPPVTFVYIPPPPPSKSYCAKQEGTDDQDASSSSSRSDLPRSHDAPSPGSYTGPLPPARLELSSNPQDAIPWYGRSLPPPMTDNTAMRFEKIEHQEHHRYSHHSHKRYHSRRPSKHPAANEVIAPPLPPGYEQYVLQSSAPLPTYHICRVCLRPRSETYHREHPVASDGVPQPPGICRRCRVTTVDEKPAHAQLINISESDWVRLGVDCLVPATSILTTEQVRNEIHRSRAAANQERQRRGNSPESNGSEKGNVKVVYRYVSTHESRKPVPAKPGDISAKNLATWNHMNDQPDAIDTKTLTTKNSLKAQRNTDAEDSSSRIIARPGITAAQVAEIDTAKASLSAHSSRSTKKEKIAERQSEKTAFSESEIRRLARDEVERYRHAERIMRTHPDPYTHGRLIPVERRIDVVRDEATVKPWEAPSETPPPCEPAGARSETGDRFSHAETSKRSPRENERVSSPDSRLWYRTLDEDEAGQCSDARDEISVPKRSEATQPYNSNFITRKATYEREIVRESSAHGRNLPVSARPRHTVDDDDDADLVLRRPSASSEKIGEWKNAHVVTGTPRKAFAEVRIDRRASDAQHGRHEYVPARAYLPDKYDMPTASQHSSLRTDRDYWEDDDGVRTIGRHASVKEDNIPYPLPYPPAREMSFREDWPSGKGQSGGPTRPRDNGQDRVYEQMYDTIPPRAMNPSRESRYRLTDHDDQSWSASGVRETTTHRASTGPGLATHRYGNDDEDDKTNHPAKSQRETATNHASSPTEDRLRRHLAPDNSEWEYRERTVQPASRPQGARPIDEEQARYIVETETYYTHKAPTSTTSETNASSARHSRYPRFVSDTFHQPHPDRQVRRMEEKPLPDRGRGPSKHVSDEQTRVRFASKVEFSPTPPASDDYPPSHDRHAERRESRRSERREHLVEGEYERRHEPIEVSSQGRGRMRERWQESSENDRRIDPHQAPYRRMQMGDRRSPGDDTDTATQVSRTRQMARALSESPSRERLRPSTQQPQRYDDHQGRQRHQTRPEKVAFDSGTDPSPDAGGPHRQEIRPESTEAVWGSRRSGPTRGHWRDV